MLATNRITDYKKLKINKTKAQKAGYIQKIILKTTQLGYVLHVT